MILYDTPPVEQMADILSKYPQVTDCGDLTKEEIKSSIARNITAGWQYYGLGSDGIVGGVVALQPFTRTTATIHICLDKSLWGKRKEMYKLLPKLFKVSKYTSFVAFIPSFNKLVISLAKGGGFKRQGALPNSFLYKWRYYDMEIFSLNKYEALGGANSCLQ